MINWDEISKVAGAMVPLYVALGLGYGAARWWKIFTPEQCDAINRLVALFTIPFFTFDFTVHTNPYTMNYRFIAADAVSKLGIIVVLVAWAKWFQKGNYAWSLTFFSLSTLNNTLVIGVPLVMDIYGKWAQDLVVQLSVVQSIVWNPALLFGLELRKAVNNGGTIQATQADDLETTDCQINFLPMMKTVWLKIARNPNVYASVLGISWSLIANRWHIKMPDVLESSILIMSKAGAGTAMFSMGLFAALQQKLIACGPSLTLLGLVLRFIVGPAAVTLGAIILGLRGNVLRLAMVIFGTLVSLPVLLVYCIVIGFI